MKNLWEKALSILRSEVNDQVFTAWFLPIQQANVDESSVTLEVPNKFFENWIREKYFSLIKTALQQASGSSVDIEFKIGTYPDSAASSPASGDEQSGGYDRPAAPPSPVGAADPAKKPSSESWLRSVFSSSRQIPESRYKDLGLNPNYIFENFVVGASNRFAHAASMAVSERPSKVYNPLFLYGGVGLGKTHLMQAIGQEVLEKNPKAKVLYIASEEFTNQLIHAIRTRTTPKFRSMYRNLDVLLVDDIQFIAGKESTQEEFFHTFNALHDAHKQIVLSSDRSPQQIKSMEERLISRFAWGLIADIHPPDFETRIAILEKKSENESVRVPKEVLYFLAENIRTNIREMEGALIRVVAYAKLTGKDISVPLAKDVLKGMIAAEDSKVTVEHIQKVVAMFYNIREADMKTKKRSRAIAYPRQMAMFLSRTLTDHSLPDIGGFFGGRDHTTVLHACDKISKEIESNHEVKLVFEKLKDKIKR